MQPWNTPSATPTAPKEARHRTHIIAVYHIPCVVRLHLFPIRYSKNVNSASTLEHSGTLSESTKEVQACLFYFKLPDVEDDVQL